MTVYQPKIGGGKREEVYQPKIGGGRTEQVYQPSFRGSPTHRVADDVVGMSRTDAGKKIAQAGFAWRIASIDGITYWSAGDYNPNQINLVIENDEVVRADVG